MNSIGGYEAEKKVLTSVCVDKAPHGSRTYRHLPKLKVWHTLSVSRSFMGGYHSSPK